MASHHFFALLSRMKYIRRWGLMRNASPENVSEHTLEVALIAHGLAVLGKERLGKTLDPAQVVLYALYHDAGEILTGDMPTPVKYYNPGIKASYKGVEADAQRRLLAMLPADLRGSFQPYINGEDAPPDIKALVKAADKISALIKCAEEEKMGNREFADAGASTLQAIRALALPEAEMFLQEFWPAYSLTLDELTRVKSAE